jgi:hypothetical protein
MFPMLKNIPHLFALFGERHIPYCGEPCRITGVVRAISDADFTNSGFTQEDFEKIRHKSSVWMLDVTGDDSECNLLTRSEEMPELWGALYASGHLELARGNILVPSVVDMFVDILKDSEFADVNVVTNHAGMREIAVFGRGVRATIGTQSPFYSVHMDVELTKGFEAARVKFDRICDRALDTLCHISKIESAVITNPA